MARLLVPLGSCSDALAAAPLVAACRERGIDAVVAWCGRDEGLDELSELGLPPPAKRGQTDGRGDPAVAFAEATAIVGTWLAEGPWAAVLSFGHGTLTLTHFGRHQRPARRWWLLFTALLGTKTTTRGHGDLV